MMIGRVEQRYALMTITFRLPGHPDIIIEFTIDTGFSDYLTLPPVAVQAMQLPFLHKAYAGLADDTLKEYDVHLATILWQGIERDVPVLAMGRRPLIGTGLLYGQELVAQFAEQGLVTVDTF